MAIRPKRNMFYELSLAEKLAIAATMATVLVFLMSYKLVGEAEHEHLSLGIMALAMLHIVFTRRAHTDTRPEALVKAFFSAAFGLVCVSGVFISKYDLDFFGTVGFSEQAKVVHLMSAYWCLIFAGAHIGLHVWLLDKLSGKWLWIRWVLRVLAYPVAAYGLYTLFTTKFIPVLFLGKLAGVIDYGVGLGGFLAQAGSVLVLCAVASSWSLRREQGSKAEVG